MSASASLLQVTLALMLMVGLILGLAWFARRFAQPMLQQQKKLHLLASLSLGIKEKIILVEVEGKQLVLGVTPHQITSLYVMDAPTKTEEQSTENINQSEKTITSEFSKKLKEILKVS